jgi:hypothetical protein
MNTKSGSTRQSSLNDISPINLVSPTDTGI